jgi:hypothetical protein
MQPEYKDKSVDQVEEYQGSIISFYPEEVNSNLLRNVGWYLQR